MVDFGFGQGDFHHVTSGYIRVRGERLHLGDTTRVRKGLPRSESEPVSTDPHTADPSRKEYFFVCAADMNGWRPGYNRRPDWDHACFVPFGGKEVAARRALSSILHGSVCERYILL